jgi:chorismate mutase
MTDPVEDAIRQFHATSAHRDQLQSQLDESGKVIGLQQAEIDRLNLTITQLSTERDHYMVQCATLKNDLGNVQTIISETVKKARDVSFGRIAREPTVQIEDHSE